MSSLFFIAPLHLPQLFRSKSPSFRSRASVAPSPAVCSKSLIAPTPVFYSHSSHDSFYPVPAVRSGFSDPSRIAAAAVRSISCAESDVKGRLLRQRMIFLAGWVDDSVALAISRQLIILDNQDHTKDIHLFISSRGGLLRAALYILRTIQSLKANVSTIGIGFIASPISIVLCGGAKGKRFSTPRTTLLLGPISDGGVEDAAKKIISIVGKKNQHYISAADAVKRGIIDAVFEEL